MNTSRLVVLLVAAATLTACASAPVPPGTVVAHDCEGVEAPTGSNIKRRGDCLPITQEEREAQRRQAEEMREGQRRLEIPRPVGGRN